MTDAQKATYIKTLAKVLNELAEQFPFYVTSDYVAKRLEDEQAKLDANDTAQTKNPLEELK